MKKIAIIGGKGMLGTELCLKLTQNGCMPIIFDLPEFEITKPAQVETAVTSTDAIINCAAYTAVDKAESEPELCAAVNATAVGLLGQIAAKHRRYLIHISTDFVFGDLTAEPQSETDPVNPLSVYGRTKRNGEELLLESGADAAIVRVQWTYGAGGQNFVTKILAAAKTKPMLQVVADQFGAPTHTGEVCNALLQLLCQKITGLYHFAANGYTSRFEVASFMLENSGLTTELKPCATADFPTPATRPLNSRFNCSKIDTVPGINRRHWQDALAEYMGTLPRG